VRRYFIGVAAALALGCGGSTDPDHSRGPNPQAVIDVAPPAEITLAIGQSLRLRNPDLQVRFLAVPEDSRCPNNVTCVWAGDARIALAATGAVERAFDLHLPTEQIGSSKVVLGPYEIEAEALEPAPVAGEDRRPEDLRLTLKVRRL